LRTADEQRVAQAQRCIGPFLFPAARSSSALAAQEYRRRHE
jgi:hypothetical protein